MRSWIALLSFVVTLAPTFAHAQPWSRHVPSLREAEQLQSGDALERRAAARAKGSASSADDSASPRARVSARAG